ncbi:hypothetical protein HHK36_012688 [Tetracentron sinense]|uniref:DUF4005 domain-containing protein n=1 Tax=Tetracentron sinense TaxID=13715 RepID=A0A834Z8R3_TETSI|nr:hypothetical protein HHK36_012688 [Tetracentron sinense]
MGKTGKWIRSFLTGKKEKEKHREKVQTRSNQSSTFTTENPTTPIVIPPTNPKEKRRWSFRRSAATKDLNSVDSNATSPPVVQTMLEYEKEQKKHAMAVAAATAAAADAAIAAAQAAATVIRLTAAATERTSAVEEAAVIKIQSFFRSYLVHILAYLQGYTGLSELHPCTIFPATARKALCALRGLVKLQALVRGHLVRKQATATLRCMQALVTVQARARAQRIRVSEEAQPLTQRPSIYRNSPQDNRLSFVHIQEMDRCMEDNIKIVEMDLGESRGSTKSRNSYSNNPQTERAEHRFSTYSAGHRANSKQDHQPQISPAPSALTDMSPRTCSGHFEEYSFNTTQSSPQCYTAASKPEPARVPFAFPQPEYADSMSHDYAFFPNYMANTESFKAKVRSQSAPKQRPDSGEKQPSRRRASMEGRNVPRSVRMQRSASHVGSTAHGCQNPWSIKLDRSTVSLKDSECGSTSTVLTRPPNMYTSVASFWLPSPKSDCVISLDFYACSPMCFCISFGCLDLMGFPVQNAEATEQLQALQV